MRVCQRCEVVRLVLVTGVTLHGAGRARGIEVDRPVVDVVAVVPGNDGPGAAFVFGLARIVVDGDAVGRHPGQAVDLVEEALDVGEVAAQRCGGGGRGGGVHLGVVGARLGFSEDRAAEGGDGGNDDVVVDGGRFAVFVGPVHGLRSC